MVKRRRKLALASRQKKKKNICVYIVGSPDEGIMNVEREDLEEGIQATIIKDSGGQLGESSIIKNEIALNGEPAVPSTSANAVHHTSVTGTSLENITPIVLLSRASPSSNVSDIRTQPITLGNVSGRSDSNINVSLSNSDLITSEAPSQIGDQASTSNTLPCSNNDENIISCFNNDSVMNLCVRNCNNNIACNVAPVNSDSSTDAEMKTSPQRPTVIQRVSTVLTSPVPSPFKPPLDDGSTNPNPGPSSVVKLDDKVVKDGENECPVCLQAPVHPSRLPCSHVFCYLCLKGIALAGQTCPLCRASIPHQYSQNPQLVPDRNTVLNLNQNQTSNEEEKFCWFYQGRHGGWWQFEQRMTDEIESYVESGSPRFEMMICGSLYIIDTYLNIQYPKNYPSKVRKLLRELPSRINRKGVAGILSRQLPSTSFTKNCPS